MKKHRDPEVLDFTPVYDFYKPHARVRYTGELVNPATGEVFTPIRRVKQSFIAECDINNIIKQFGQTGQFKHINARAAQGAYLDLPDSIDFQQSLQIIKDGENAFASLPAKTRDRFGNDPASFLAFMADPQNAAEAIKLGLATSVSPAPAGSPTEPPAGTEPSNPAKPLT